MKITKVEFAGRLGTSKQQVQKWVEQGMPIDSIESAEAWVMAKRAKGGSADTVPMKPDKDFDETVEKQRELKAIAYKKYLDDIDTPEASKSYATYDKLVKTLVTLEKEMLARQIASRELIRTQTAIERFGKVLSDLRQQLIQLGTKVAPKANPDHPGRALKAIDEEINRILSRIAETAVEAEQGVTEGTSDEVDPTELEIVEDGEVEEDTE